MGWEIDHILLGKTFHNYDGSIQCKSKIEGPGSNVETFFNEVPGSRIEKIGTNLNAGQGSQVLV